MYCYVSEASVLVFLKVDPCGTQRIVLLVVSCIQLQSSFSPLKVTLRAMSWQVQPKTEFHYYNLQLFKNESLGTGSYGSVCKAKLDELPCAAKLLHSVLFQFNDPGSQLVMQRFEREFEFLSEIRHPRVVQYLGVAHDPESGQPVLLMEMMDESLTGFLERRNEPLPYHLQVDLCYDIALALSYLHSNGIIHRDLSSNNVLLIAGRKAKVTDFGMSKLADVAPRLTPLTQCPGTGVYMAPEALRHPPVYSEKLDIFSFGVLATQIVTLHYPDPTAAMTEQEDSRYPTGTVLVPVPEIQRRKTDIDSIDPNHPLLPLILRCLKNKEQDRPSSQELCHRLAALKEGSRYIHSMQAAERKQQETTMPAASEGKDKKIQEKQLQIQELKQEIQILKRKLQTAGLVRRLQDVRIQQLLEKEQELEMQEQDLHEKDIELQLKNCEIEKIEEELQQRNDKLCQKNKELEEVSRELKEKCKSLEKASKQLEERDNEVCGKDQLLKEKDQELQQQQELIGQLRMSRFSYRVSGSGIEKASVNAASQFSVNVTYPSSRPSITEQNITVEVVSLADGSVTEATVVRRKPSKYQISYTPVVRGQHKLHVKVSGSDIKGSPFKLFVQQPPTVLTHPVRTIDRLSEPSGVALNSQGDLYITECSASKVSVLDNTGQVCQTSSSMARHLTHPTGIATDADDNVYVACEHKLLKFDKDGELIQHTGSEGSVQGKFHCPKGVKVHNKQVYTCDSENHRIQIFSLSLEFIRSIGTVGSRVGQLSRPQDLAVDGKGNLYVTDMGNNRVQVLSPSGRYIHQFGHKGDGKLSAPSGIHLLGDYVFVADSGGHRIAVFQCSGQFVSAFGLSGDKPHYHAITSDCNGFVYVCDPGTNSVLVY